ERALPDNARTFIRHSGNKPLSRRGVTFFLESTPHSCPRLPGGEVESEEWDKPMLTLLPADGKESERVSTYFGSTFTSAPLVTPSLVQSQCQPGKATCGYGSGSIRSVLKMTSNCLSSLVLPMRNGL